MSSSYHLCVEYFSQLSFDSEVYTKSAAVPDFVYTSESNKSCEKAFSLEFQKISQSLEQFFLTVGLNNFGNKIPIQLNDYETRQQNDAIQDHNAGAAFTAHTFQYWQLDEN